MLQVYTFEMPAQARNTTSRHTDLASGLMSPFAWTSCQSYEFRLYHLSVMGRPSGTVGQDRFLSSTPTDRFRRYQRDYQRATRAAADAPSRPVDSREGSRHRQYPCCGRRRCQCKCNWTDIEKAICPEAWDSFTSSVRSGSLLKLADTQDCGPAMVEFRGISDFAQLWALCLMFRYFSHCPTWRALVSSGAVTVDGTKPTQSPVNQALAASVLADMWESSSRGSQVFGGGRRALPIRKTIDWSGKLKNIPIATSRQKGSRDGKALALFWQHRPTVELQALKANPCPECFRNLRFAYERFQKHYATGLGPYFLKCVLDLFLPLSKLPESSVGSEWPVSCPGYQSAMKVLVPKLPREMASRFLLYIYRSRVPSAGSDKSGVDYSMTCCCL